MSNHVKDIQALADKLIKQLGLNGSATVEQKKDFVQVQLDIEETGLMIGYHGETLDSLRLLLGQLVFKKTGEWIKLGVNVGDYQQEREEQLQRMADQIVDKVKSTHQSETMPPLNARERRLIHLYLETIEGVRSESVGEDDQRRLVVFPT